MNWPLLLAILIATTLVLQLLLLVGIVVWSRSWRAADGARERQTEILEALGTYSHEIEESTRMTRHTLKALVAALAMEDRVRALLLEARSMGIVESEPPGES